jgi:hypothetical protein
MGVNCNSTASHNDTCDNLSAVTMTPANIQYSRVETSNMPRLPEDMLFYVKNMPQHQTLCRRLNPLQKRAEGGGKGPLHCLQLG